MSHLCNDGPEVAPGLWINPDALSARDHAVRRTFSRMTSGRRSVPPSVAYQAYERSVARENSYAALMGVEMIELATRNDFIASAWEERAERSAFRLLHSRRAIAN
ncbi:hypothetical protein [Rhizobium sp. 22-785-1]